MVAAKNLSLAALLWVGLASKGLAMGIDEATNDLIMVERSEPADLEARTVAAPKPSAGKMSIQVVRDEAPELEVRTPPQKSGGQGKKQAGPRMPGQGGAGRPDRVGPVRSSNKPTGAGHRGHGTRDIEDEIFEREFDDELFERDFDDELFERDFDDELFERDFDDELFERDFDDELFERDFDDELFERDFDDELFERDFEDILEVRTPPRMPGQGGAGRPDRVGPIRSSNKPTGAGHRGHRIRSLDTRLNRAVPLHMAPGGPASGIYSGVRHKGGKNTRDIFERNPPRMPGQGGAGRPDRVGPIRSSNKPTGAGHRGHRIRDIEEE